MVEVANEFSENENQCDVLKEPLKDVCQSDAVSTDTEEIRFSVFLKNKKWHMLCCRTSIRVLHTLYHKLVCMCGHANRISQFLNLKKISSAVFSIFQFSSLSFILLLSSLPVGGSTGR